MNPDPRDMAEPDEFAMLPVQREREREYLSDSELPGMWEAADLAGGWADTEAERLTRPHRDRKWPKGETPSLFAGMTGHEGEE